MSNANPEVQFSPFLTIRDLHKSYGEQQVLRGVDLDLRAGSVMCLMGPSGSGKSTLLRCITRLEEYQRGAVWLEGELVGLEQGSHGRLIPTSARRLRRQRTQIGMVFQSFNLFPHMTALENVAVGPRWVLDKRNSEATEIAELCLGEVGLAQHANKYPSQLSGGQQQRVAIARSMAMSPKLILFDEPTSALDPELIGEVLQTMAKLAKDGMTMLVVTHEIGFARKVADHVVFMEGGVIVEQGPPVEVLDRPKERRTQEFVYGKDTSRA